METYIILCDFHQGDLATLSASSGDLQQRATALGDSRDPKDVKVLAMHQTFGPDDDVDLVVVVEASDADRALSEILTLFDEGTEPTGTTVLTVSESVPENVLKEFNGHTNM